MSPAATGQQRLADTLAAVLDALPAHIALLDEHGVITSVNRAWRTFANANGMPPGDFGVGLPYLSLREDDVEHRSEDARRAAAAIRTVLAGDSPEVSFEYPCHSPTEMRWFRMTATPLRVDPAGGRADGAVVSHIDVSDAKHAQLAALLEQSDDLILVLDVQGRIMTVNPAFMRATGWSLLQAATLEAAMWHGPVPTGVAEHARLEQARHDGSSFKAEWSVSPIFGRGGAAIGHICVGRDITRTQQIEDSLRENDKLRAVATLAGGIAHDFNNLLGSIMGLTELCALEAVQGSRQARNLARIGQAGVKAAALVRQMLDFSRQTPLLLQPTSIGALLASVDGLLRAALPANVSLVLAIDEDGPVAIDVVQMEQVLLNLTRNAADAMGEAGGEIRIGVDRVRTDDGQPASAVGGRIRLRVHDNGGGIAPDVLNKIFEPFFTTKPVGEGTGLGLAAVHGIVANHGGTIEVASELGVGTTFSLFLPLLEHANELARSANGADSAGSAHVKAAAPLVSPA